MPFKRDYSDLSL